MNLVPNRVKGLVLQPARTFGCRRRGGEDQEILALRFKSVSENPTEMGTSGLESRL